MDENWITIVFARTTQKPPQKTKDKIINIMIHNPEITITEISQLLNTGRDTINEHIAKLKKENQLKRVGGRKEGYWEIMQK